MGVELRTNVKTFRALTVWKHKVFETVSLGTLLDLKPPFTVWISKVSETRMLRPL